jgi:hypothetical protein
MAPRTLVASGVKTLCVEVLLRGESGGYADDLARTAIWRGGYEGPLICEVRLKNRKLDTENR